MSKIFYFYSTMNGLKSSFLIDLYANCKKFGYSILIFSHYFDNRYGFNIVASKLGQKEYAYMLDEFSNIFFIFFNFYKKSLYFFCILIDEVQFLNKKHLKQIVKLAEFFNIPIFCFGLFADFLNKSFLSSRYLFFIVHSFLKTNAFCFCGDFAVFNVRFNFKKMKIEKKGRKILIGGYNLYSQLCSRHYEFYWLQKL